MHSESRQSDTAKDISKIEARAFGVLLDVPVPFPLEKPDVCKDGGSGVKCPLKKDQEVEYKASFFIEKSVPSVI
ncbi:Ecdysteroid-regulated 16 kDa protein [Harpegnathos saltator]|uniref:Ecdysteroid-regulated 16 kDa protein n=1 Tax=Harpegnathos saltator TaxID=610380 RepID=E2BSS3_HARSA|nr:Ecdysteroid-regulated 16 kDa protein [Harpegnathos saltator]